VTRFAVVGRRNPQGVNIDEATRQAWHEIYTATAPEILRFLVKLTGDREIGRELMQETFVRAIRAGLDGVESRRPWLFRIATNLARDRYRADRRHTTEALTGDEADERLVFDPEVDAVHRALATLPFEDATALLFHYDVGLSASEVAELADVGEEAMKSRLRRARQRFMTAYRREQGG
jgi:RNA polymerase sigma-70 factor (ECF subfamily)